MFYSNLAIILFLTMFSSNQGNEDGWKRLKPLHSTRTEAENILGESVRKDKTPLYETEKERVLIWYSKGSCKESKWNVTKDTILAIEVIPKEILLISEVFKDLKQFEKFKDDRSKDIFHYSNKDNSISFQTRKLSNNDEKILDILYLPSESNKKLRCNPN